MSYRNVGTIVGGEIFYLWEALIYLELVLGTVKELLQFIFKLKLIFIYLSMFSFSEFNSKMI